MTNDPKDRFGMPEEAFRAAYESHGNAPVFRVGMYVPTREEVANLPASSLRTYLIEWIYESPTELIPSRAQIEEVRAVLEARPDAEDLSDMIHTCRIYAQTE